MATSADEQLDDHDEPHGESLATRLNWLRAAVLGANDGIVSTAGVVVGVAGATGDRGAILIAGIAALVAGAISMAAGEYVSVSTQRDTERSVLRLERWELRHDPEGELEELAQLYQDKGISRPLAEQVARELTAHDALGAHAEAELGIDPNDLTNPWHAAWASMAAFTAGALLPLLTITFSPAALRTWVTVASVTIALALTGLVSAQLGGIPVCAPWSAPSPVVCWRWGSPTSSALSSGLPWSEGEPPSTAQQAPGHLVFHGGLGTVNSTCPNSVDVDSSGPSAPIAAVAEVDSHARLDIGMALSARSAEPRARPPSAGAAAEPACTSHHQEEDAHASPSSVE